MVAPPKHREATRTPLRVLVVEDSEDDALLLLRELKRAGYEVVRHEMVDTPERMEAALVSSYDVIFSDYRMPRFEAPEALAMARKAGSEAPFIVVSGKVGEDVAARMVKAGAYDYVMKDNMTRLGATIARGLEEAEERRELQRAEKELRRRDTVLQAVGFAAERFLSEAAGWEESIEEVLERLGTAAEASRVYVFENHPGEDGEVWGAQSYEWVAPGVSTRADNEAVSYRNAGYGRWVELWSRGEAVYGHTREFPEVERPELEARDIRSIAIVPIFVEGRWWGQIGFDECRSEREWSATEMDALRAAAGTLGAAIQRRRTEEELRGSEERYRAVIEQATDGIYLLDANSRRILETNPSFQKMLGYTAAELQKMEVYDFVAHDRENIDAVIRRTLEQKRRIVGERKYRRKDDSLLDVEVGVSVISYGGKEVICTIVRDITERKIAEEALARSENRLRTIIETEPECVKVLGMDGALMEMNPAGLSMIEADSLEQVRGKTVYDYIAPDHRTDFVELTESVLRGGSGTLEFELVGLKGTSRWLDTHAVPLRDAQSEIAGLLAITRDITGRKKNEEALRHSERLYRAVIEQARENIYLVDTETKRIVESNPAFRETLGYTEEELGGMTLYDIVDADRESIDANVRRVVELRNPFVGQRQYRRKDGSLVDVEVSASTILHNGRETLCVVAHDVTERARAQELLEERLETFSRIAARLTLDLPVQDTLDAMAESVVNAGTAVSCSVILVDERTGFLRIEGSHGLPEGFKAGIETIWRNGSVRSPTVEALRTSRPTLDMHMRQRMLENPLYAPVHSSVRDVEWDTVFIVPLVSRGRTLGVLNLGYPEGEQPGEDEKVFLTAVADQAAVAVENTRLFAEARGKAALEERQRLARELHDSVSQALYGIALGAKTARTLLARDPERVGDPLDYVLSLAEAGMAEMRALIFELRPESLESEGLIAALEKQAASLRARHEISVEAALCDEPGASLEVKEAIYRIAQEALHNIVKHARARNVEINMCCGPQSITLEVSDDGLGFETHGDFPGHLGLRSMRERASSLGGTLEVESAPGEGTRIQARIPVYSGLRK